MARYQVILAYDGTSYYGFQRQAGKPTVQAMVENSLRQLGWQGTSILAAGRTDTGVHASGQVVAFDLDWRHSPEELQGALNAHLPDAIVAHKVMVAQAKFHPRYSASGRHYRYHIFCQQHRDPLHERYAWRVWPPVDYRVLTNVARSITGTHNFAAFGTPARAGAKTDRTVSTAEWHREDRFTEVDHLVFEIVADGFLYHMVRRLVYLQVATAQGKEAETRLTELLEQPPSQPVQGLAPAHGLVLLHVYYPEDTPA